MEIKYYTTENDYLILLNKILEKSIFGKNFGIFVRVTIPALSWLSVILPFLKYQEFNFGFWIRTLIAIVITIGWGLFYERYTKSVFKSIINKDSLVRYAGSTILTITDNYIQETTETTTSKSLWSEIEGMKTSNTHIFIFFTPLIAAVIPKTAFSNLIEYDDFTNKVNRYIESNHV